MKLDTKNSENIVKKWFFVVFQKFLYQPEGALYILFVLSKRCSKKMRKRKPVRSVISIKLESNFSEFTFQHGCSFERSAHELLTLFDVKNFNHMFHIWKLQKSLHQCGSLLFNYLVSFVCPSSIIIYFAISPYASFQI